MIEGWLLDLHAGKPGEMVVWLKTKNESVVKLTDLWLPKLYVASDDKSSLSSLIQRRDVRQYIRDWGFEYKFEKITDANKSLVLRITVNDAEKLAKLARVIENSATIGFYRIYNADIKPEQSYLYEKDLFPLCFCQVDKTSSCLRWSLKDDVYSTDYDTPPLKKVQLHVEANKAGKIPCLNDPIKQVVINDDGNRIIIDKGSDEEKLIESTRTIQYIDPDIIFTDDGDSFTMPYLASRAKACNLELQFSRDADAPLKRPSKLGTSYFSYGKILYKPSTTRLYGRIHIDTSNAFVFYEAGLEGLYEVSRICRIPLHIASRASIGKCMSNLQFYWAHRNDILVPWKPVIAEGFKTRLEMLIADRGGMVFEPIVGLYEGAAELDFASLYPNVMLKKNLSCETVRCECCNYSSNRVPELGWNVCTKRIGITPMTLKILLSKRAEYKRLVSIGHSNKETYDARQAAIKWILVTCFGYLGFNNAKFGRIDAHIAVCAWARKILLDSTRIAERNGYKVIHGIVDSLWLQKDKATEEDYLALSKEIEDETGFKMSFEGIYKWIAFLDSKTYDNSPVVNRYFGVFKNNKIKVRGIEARRHDTPIFFSKYQAELLNILAKGNSVAEARGLVNDCKDTFRKYALLLYHREVPVKELVFTKRLSKIYREYSSNTLEAIVAKQLAREGAMLHAGQTVRYLITNYYSKQPNTRAMAEQFLTKDATYDTRRYIELLAEVSASVLEPFGCSKEEILRTPIFENPLQFV